MEEKTNAHKQCHVCGQEIDDTWGYCAKCGVQLRRKYADMAPKERVFWLMDEFSMAVKNLDVVCDAILRENIDRQSANDALAFAREETNNRLNRLANAVYELLKQ